MRSAFLALAAVAGLALAPSVVALDPCAEEALQCPATILTVGDPVHTIYECRNNVEGALPMASKLNPSKGTEVLPRGCNWQYINGVRQAAPCSTTFATHSVVCGEK
jgi:hypothetical protein